MQTRLKPRDMLKGHSPKRGVLKCRLLHMDGRSVIQPDALLDKHERGHKFYLPIYFDPCELFWNKAGDDFGRLTMVIGHKSLVRVAFRRQDKIKVCRDGSVIYKCYYAVIDGPTAPAPSGQWRYRNGQWQLRLYHHTNDAGFMGISSSQSLWSSQRNLQGSLYLKNIAYHQPTSKHFHMLLRGMPTQKRA